MAIRFAIRPTAVPPGSMPREGGTVAVSFVAQSSKKTFLQQTCTIRPATPYVFTTPQDPADPKVHSGPIESVAVVQQRFGLVLDMARQPGTPPVTQALLDLSIQEVTEAGNARRLASRPVRATVVPIVITIE